MDRLIDSLVGSWPATTEFIVLPQSQYLELRGIVVDAGRADVLENRVVHPLSIVDPLGNDE